MLQVAYRAFGMTFCWNLRTLSPSSGIYSIALRCKRWWLYSSGAYKGYTL